MVAILEMPLQIKADDAPAYVAIRLQPYSRRYYIEHATDRSSIATGQAIMKGSSYTLKNILIHQKRDMGS